MTPMLVRRFPDDRADTTSTPGCCAPFQTTGTRTYEKTRIILASGRRYNRTMAAAGTTNLVVQRTETLRAIALWMLRLLGLAMLVRGVYLIANRMAFGLSQGDIALGWNAYMGVGEQHMLAAGIAATVVGLALVLLARPMSRLAIAMPDTGCPACGHTGEVDGDGRCVECGCVLVRCDGRSD